MIYVKQIEKNWIKIGEQYLRRDNNRSMFHEYVSLKKNILQSRDVKIVGQENYEIKLFSYITKIDSVIHDLDRTALT